MPPIPSTTSRGRARTAPPTSEDSMAIALSRLVAEAMEPPPSHTRPEGTPSPARLSLHLRSDPDTSVDLRAPRLDPLAFSPELLPASVVVPAAGRPPAPLRMGPVFHALLGAVTLAVFALALVIFAGPRPTSMRDVSGEPTAPTLSVSRAASPVVHDAHARSPRSRTVARASRSEPPSPVAGGAPSRHSDVEAESSLAPDAEAAGGESRSTSTSTSESVSKSTSKSRTKTKTELAGASQDAEPEVPKRPSSTDSRGLSADCILDPSRCDRAIARTDAAPSRPASPRTKPVTSKDDGLPDKLTSAQIRKGLSLVKDEAEACALRNGAPTGAKVQVKLSIAGSTGEIAEASPRGEFASTSLGRCVARALSAAAFPRFERSRMGVLYSVRM